MSLEPQRASKLVLMLCLFFLLPSLASGSSITVVPGPPEVTLTLVPTGSGFLADLRGTAGLTFGDPVISNVTITDGVPFGGTPPPFNNSLMLGLNYPAFSEFIVLTFDFSSLVTLPADGPGPDAFILGGGIPLTPITDPGLQALLKTNVYGFEFDSVAFGTDGQAFFSYHLASVDAVPEPGTLLLLATGLLGGGARMFRVRRGTKV